MATPDTNFFELQRRAFLWSAIITLDDGVTPLGYDADPNAASASGTPGEQKLYNMPPPALYFESLGKYWFKVAVPNTWIEGGGGGSAVNAVSFMNVIQVDIVHGLGRRPIVQVLEKALGGLFGTDEGFGTSFGSSDIYREIEPVHVEVHHLNTNAAFRVLLDNYYTGEVLYT